MSMKHVDENTRLSNGDTELYSGEITTKLSFAGQQLKLNKAEDGEKIAEKIRDCVILDTLELKGNTLGVEATMPIADALESRPELRHALWSDMFTGRLKQEIPRTLERLTSAMMLCGARLVELDLSDNAIGPMAMPGLKDFLASESASELKILNLNNCGLGIAGKTIAECLMKCHSTSLEIGTPLRLQKFIAGRNRLEQASSIALAKAFKQIKTLEEIVMPQNGIRPEGIMQLAEAVKANPLLKVLNLSDNIFREEGAMSMANAISELALLDTLDFSDCLCRNRGSVEICNQLMRSRIPLKTLILSGNEIDYEAARQIIERMQKVDGLKSLKLGLNCFGSQFEILEQLQETHNFLDVGAESEDEGSLEESFNEGTNDTDDEDETDDDGNESDQ